MWKSGNGTAKRAPVGANNSWHVNNPNIKHLLGVKRKNQSKLTQWYMPHLTWFLAWKTSQPPSGANQAQKPDSHLCQYEEGLTTGQFGTNRAILAILNKLILSSLSSSLGSQVDLISSLACLSSLSWTCKTALSVIGGRWRSSGCFTARWWRMWILSSSGKCMILTQASSATFDLISSLAKIFCWTILLTSSLLIFCLSAASLFHTKYGFFLNSAFLFRLVQWPKSILDTAYHTDWYVLKLFVAT